MKANMEKTLAVLLVCIYMLAGCAATLDDFLPDTEALPFATPTPIPQLTLKDVPSATPKPTPTPDSAEEEAASQATTPKPVSEDVLKLLRRNLKVWKETQERPGMDGRLLIPAAGIDVALFSSGEGENVDDMRQRVTDAVDSALLYYDGLGFVIADHSNQAFASLPLVHKGDKAYILEGNSILTLSCDLTTRGINTGAGITDTDGDPVTQEALFTCYTCGEDWTQIYIVGLNEADEDLFALSRDADMECGWRYADAQFHEIVLLQIEEAREQEAQRAAEAVQAEEQQEEDSYN